MLEAAAASTSCTATVGEDAPIVAALASHRKALDDAQARAQQLVAEISAGPRSSGLRHQAEVAECGLTDQLHQLTEMRDDCRTVEGRELCKAVIDRLHGIGRTLLRVSQSAEARQG